MIKSKYKIGTCFEAKAENLIARVYLMRRSEVAEVWKWEVIFHSDKAPGGTDGWGASHRLAKHDAQECANLFCAGKLGAFRKAKKIELDD